MASIEERVSRLEGGYSHLATRSDVADVRTEIADLRGEVKAEIADLKGELKGMKWTFGTLIAAAAVGLAVLQVVLKYVA